MCAQSDFLHALPSSLFCPTSFTPSSSVSTKLKEKADLHNLKNAKPLPQQREWFAFTDAHTV